jgi:perosamine synthetase
MARLRERQIDSRPFFVPMHENPPYARSDAYPVSTRLGRQGINLPSAPSLSAADIARVADAIRDRGGA